MTGFQLYGDDWDATQERPGFSWRRTRVGQRIGAELIGGSLYELEPGEKTWPYHLHHGNEEWLVVIAGTPTLRMPEEQRQLEPGDTVCFPAGPAGAHQVVNRSEEACRMLILSTLNLPDVVEYPDSAKVGVRTASGRYNVRREPELDYWDGE